jgi:hypothetical protein
VRGGEPGYRDRLGAVLRARDPAALRAFLLDSARRFGDQRQLDEVSHKSDAELEELMHRMIVARPDLAALHRASRDWLARHGIKL